MAHSTLLSIVCYRHGYCSERMGMDRFSANGVTMLVEPKERVRWLTKEDAFRLFDELPEHILAIVKFTLLIRQ